MPFSEGLALAALSGMADGSRYLLAMQGWGKVIWNKLACGRLLFHRPIRRMPFSEGLTLAALSGMADGSCKHGERLTGLSHKKQAPVNSFKFTSACFYKLLTHNG